MGSTIQTIAANLRNAAWAGTPAQIGGGTFGRDECAAGAAVLELYPDMLAALKALLHQCEYIASEIPDAMAHPDLVNARAILARIDGTPAPTGEAARPDPAEALRAARSFIEGFEGDELQDGEPERILALIDAATGGET